MPFEIVRNDIAKMKVDAIVNTANPRPVIGSGTDYAIHKAAGPQLLEARKKIGDLMPGQSVATPAFKLQAKYVLHTVSPIWQDGRHSEPELLRKAYDAALALALQLKCSSIAFPLMAAGSYAFPHDQALSVAIQAFTDFLMTHDLKIYLVIFNGKAFSLAGSLFDGLKSYIDENYVSERAEEEYSPNGPRQRRELDDLRRYNEYYSASHAAVGELADTQSAAPLPSAASLDDVLSQAESSFSEYLLDLLKERGGKDSEVYRRAQVSRQLFHKIINQKDYQPNKSTAIQLALGLGLDLAQTQKLLGKAGYSLSRSSKADLVVQYFIERKEYNIVSINLALDDCGLPPLKTGIRR